MMRKLFVAVLMAALVATSCSSLPGGATSNDPVGAVNRVMQLITAKQFTQIAPAICAAKRDEIAGQLDISQSLASSLPGVDANAILGAMTIAITDLQVNEVSRTGNTALVAVKGTMALTFDQARLREILAPVLEQQGLPASALDSTLATLSAQTLPIDSQVEVVNENGTWLVCGSLE